MDGSSIFWLGMAFCFGLLAYSAYRQKIHLQRKFAKKGGIPGSAFTNDNGELVMPTEEFRKGLKEMCNIELIASLLAFAGAVFSFFQ